MRFAFLILLSVAPLCAQTSGQIEFFEKKVRPVLAENCYACHNAETMAAAELVLDSKDGARRGGTRGPAVVPGDPAASLLLKATSYRDLELKMPPAGKLSEEVLADLRSWIEMGAPDPREAVTQTAPAEESGIDWEEARKFWAFQPIEVPALPDGAAKNPIDRFVNAKLASAGLEPSAEADKRALIRRATFDLTGLPPTPQEVRAFLADDQPGAWPRLVDGLLASPHYGERWGRHWLDLVRFAETDGHEFDNDKPNAWRYRDYVVRAFNEDLPYDRFVREQIAGDLLEEPRLTRDGKRYEAPIGAGMYWLWEVLNSPTDSVKSRADQVDNQIDVMSKAFFGMTLACARCHDHKFDPLPTADYYALAGVLHSTELRQRWIDSPEVRAELRATRQKLATLETDARRRLRSADRASGRLARVSDEEQRAAWSADRGHPLFALARLSEESDEPFAQRLQAVRAELVAEPGDRAGEVWEDFADGYAKWDVDGAAFGDGPTHRLLPGVDGHLGSPVADSLGGAEEFTGLLTTRKFRIPAKEFLHVRLAGTETDDRLRDRAKLRVTLIASDYNSQNLSPTSAQGMEWITKRLVLEKGRLGKIQIVDLDREGHIAVDRIVFSDSEEPPLNDPHPAVVEILERDDVDSMDALTAAYEELTTKLGPADEALLDSLVGPAAMPAELEAVRRTIAGGVPESSYAMSSQDHDPHDVRLHQRGNHKNLGEEVPRGFLTVVAGEKQRAFRNGSGRLELADLAVSPKNTLTPRVFVNRVWKHHFGEGIVRSTDNFGKMGEPPSHPELLDHLAAEFVADGWSIKRLHRRILMSETYRRDSRASDPARERDPTNKLLSHMPVRRLEAEAVRDSILAVAGTLDRTLGGPSVPPHISEFQDGRGKPKTGPVDGDGRRSLYVGIRRNFLTPLFLAFDYPTPITTMGRRGVSAVPSQALILLNNEFVNQQARLWAQAALERQPDSEARLVQMYEEAYARPPTAKERATIREFLQEQRARYRDEVSDAQVWTDLAHVLINSTEFIFVR